MATGTHGPARPAQSAPDSPFLPWPTRAERGRVASLFVAFACLAFFFFGATKGWKHNLCDRHGFRQAQTAITAYYMLHQPWSLAYETPVVGPPWSVPFEFPLYQWIVAATTNLSHLPLEQAGRLVSVVFFLLTLWPLASILRRLRLTRSHRLLIGALVVASPFYVFWSRTFMIESTALFLALSYLALVLTHVNRGGVWFAFLATVVGTLGAAVKVTTFLPFAIAAGAVLVVDLIRKYRASSSWRDSRSRAGLGLLVAGAPVVALVAWTHFADAQKSANMIGRHLTSGAVKTFTLGTLAQRGSWQVWRTILGYESLVLGSLLFAGVLVLGLIFGRRRLQIVACLLLFVVAPLAFTNLYYVHDYYTYGSAILLLTAVGISLVSLLERGPWHAGMATSLLAILLGTFGYRYWVEYYPAQAHEAASWKGVATQIGRVSGPDDTLLVLGYDWSSELPYYTHRRAVMVPGWLPEIQNTADVLSTALNLSIHHIVVHAASRANGFDAHQLVTLAHAHGIEVERAYGDQELTIYHLTESKKPV